MIARIAPSINGIRKTLDTTLSVVPGPVADLDDRRSHGMSVAVVATDDPQVVIREIHALWHRVQDNFLAIGRYLYIGRQGVKQRVAEQMPGLGVKELEVQQLRAFKQEIVDRLPFGIKVANQFECVARCVLVEQRIARNELPRTYSVAYQVSTLDEQQMTKARQAGLLRPDVGRSAIIAFKAEQGRKAGGDANARLGGLLRRREALYRSIEKMTLELEALDRDIVREKAD